MRLGKAKLIKHKTQDGNWSIREHVPLGKEYTVDLDSVHSGKWYSMLHERYHNTETIDVFNEATGTFLPMPTELLELIEEQNANINTNVPKAERGTFNPTCGSAGAG